MSRCVGCDCTDRHACIGEDGPCYWLHVAPEYGIGVCSECPDQVEAYEAALRERERSAG